MKQSINVYQFRDAFQEMGRSDNFSYAALGYLFDYFEDYDTGEEIELDVIAICCEFTEFESIEEVVDAYDIDVDDCGDDSERFDTVQDYLQYHTSIVYMNEDDYNCIVIANF